MRQQRTSAQAGTRATLLGGVAIGLWSALALLTTFTRGLPAFETLGLGFGVAATAGFILLAARGRAALARLKIPAPAWLLGFAGLLLYHALYFVALGHAPPAQASLIAYLWPLLIVLFAALLPGGRLAPAHIAGAALGLGGTALLLLGPATGTGPAAAGGQAGLGYAAAAGCAFVWSGYSVLNRHFAAQPSEALVGVCAAVSVCGLAARALFQPWVPPTPVQWAALIALGLGPLGLAFLAWDHATKHGRLALLGTLAYLAPLISTLLLIACGRTAPRLDVLGAALLIIAGAAVAARAR
jgi:drug/metabolite transporter (DMT)-like permease